MYNRRGRVRVRACVRAHARVTSFETCFTRTRNRYLRLPRGLGLSRPPLSHFPFHSLALSLSRVPCHAGIRHAALSRSLRRFSKSRLARIIAVKPTWSPRTMDKSSAGLEAFEAAWKYPPPPGRSIRETFTIHPFQ